MAMQTGVGFSKILILAGAGTSHFHSLTSIILIFSFCYTGTILLKNGKLSDMLGELQSLVKGLEKTGDQSDDSDALLAQVRRLSTEIRQLASARQITVLNGDSGVKLTSLVIPAATLGALGYGYMWWKGISFSDLFWVTKRNMALAVENLTKHLDSVSDALSAAKKHLTQRIQNLDDKMETQKEISKSIQESVSDMNEVFSNASHCDEESVMISIKISGIGSFVLGVRISTLSCAYLLFGTGLLVEVARMDLSNIEYDLDALQRMISGLVRILLFFSNVFCSFDGKIGSLEYKQDLANAGVWYLCNMVGGKKAKMPEALQEQLKLSGKPRSLLMHSGTPTTKGLKDFVDIFSASMKDSGRDAIVQDDIYNLEDEPRGLHRSISGRC
ncbi:bZIP transcription factor bZIP109 isoform X1 [Gossypium australe]|uniref:BZIP transcription factor bZIP109 isoform X1 n=1 Tax=Gossypium australe TaxID=47621 RepID=A0A5B6UZK9_9ROSI|nr:bZIP transcription factor bZIP109 isoform X1 [Gossypium australe]